jgi:hypothetical protein
LVENPSVAVTVTLAAFDAPAVGIGKFMDEAPPGTVTAVGGTSDGLEEERLTT